MSDKEHKDKPKKEEQPAVGVSVDIGESADGAVVIAAGRDVILAPPKPSVDSLMQRATEMLSFGAYDNAFKTCTQVLMDDPRHPEANLLAGIALLKGRGADRLSGGSLTRVEEHLKRAAEHPVTATTALAVLGIVKYDHYVANGLFEGEPSLGQVVQRLQKAGYRAINQDLLQCVKASRGARKRLGLI